MTHNPFVTRVKSVIGRGNPDVPTGAHAAFRSFV